MKDTIKLIFTLVIICVIAGFLLALVQKVTLTPIQETEKSVKNEAMNDVLPGHDNDPLADKIEIDTDGNTWTFYIARKDGAYAGVAFESTSTRGYGGDITVMVGVDSDGRLTALKVTGQKETPGLGAKIVDPVWRAQFSGKSITDTKWAVKKDQGDIDQITAATISSRAVAEAVKAGLDVYTANLNEISAKNGGAQ